VQFVPRETRVPVNVSRVSSVHTATMRTSGVSALRLPAHTSRMSNRRNELACVTVTPHYGGYQTGSFRAGLEKSQHLAPVCSIPISVSLVVWQQRRWREEKLEKVLGKEERSTTPRERRWTGDALRRPVHVAGAATLVAGDNRIRITQKLPIFPERAKFISAHTIEVDTSGQTGKYGK
jgi:hypothetical protein